MKNTQTVTKMDNVIPFATNYRNKLYILIVNGAAIVGCTIFILYAQAGAPASDSLLKTLPYWIALLLLISSELLIWIEKYRAAAIAMLFGGAGTFPIGLLAIIGALASYRLWVKVNTPEQYKISCLNCGYDLRETPVPRCPECGYLKGFNKTAEELGIDKAIDLNEL